MKRLAIYLVCTLVGAIALHGQETSKKYFFDGDDIIFYFDTRDYDKARIEGTEGELDFADLDVYRVAVAGQFGDWSEDQWTMKPKGRYIFELRKKLSDFDVLPTEFKFIINDQFVAESGQIISLGKEHSSSFFSEAFGIEPAKVNSTDTSGITFFLEGNERADRVILTGTFVNWDESQLQMRKVADGWTMNIDLEPGRHQYKFIIDGAWIHDPMNPAAIENEHGTLNSIIEISRWTDFVLSGYSDARQVYLVGTFNNWSRAQMFKNDEGDWAISIPLHAGKHGYNFVVDGRWHVDVENPRVERGKNKQPHSVIILR